ncbi:uncharacterized protein RJT20DRAFT_134504 [Scheffersomyces xylosifermentans]|uniref:uncharacterized protein n=1 Tax=Scheffersomyces xylosifermentans TaxID=1304137 RepID=UPI00315C8CCE
METVVIQSSSINNSFISTIDHLPCDVIRSLWLVQSCNIAVNKEKERLHELLLRLQHEGDKESLSNKSDIVSSIVDIRAKIRKLDLESIQELRALKNQLITHKIGLSDELAQLQQIHESRINRSSEVDSDKAVLRKQLIEHYKENPLISQLEAQKEQDELNKYEDALQKNSTEVENNNSNTNKSSGLKLVLKIPHKHPKNKLKLKIRKPKIEQSKPIPVQPTKKEKKVVVTTPVFDKAATSNDIQSEDSNKYCFCKQGSFGDMIACDNEDSCPNGEWFHYKCVGLLNRVEALKYSTGKIKWFCSDHCREVVTSKLAKENENRRKKKKRRRW